MFTRDRYIPIYNRNQRETFLLAPFTSHGLKTSFLLIASRLLKERQRFRLRQLKHEIGDQKDQPEIS